MASLPVAIGGLAVAWIYELAREGLFSNWKIGSDKQRESAKFLNNLAGPNVKNNNENFIVTKLQDFIKKQLKETKDIEEYSYTRNAKNPWKLQKAYFKDEKNPGKFLHGQEWVENWERVTTTRPATETDVVENLIESSVQIIKKAQREGRAPLPKELKSNDYVHGWTIPGYNYCGPGNSLNLGYPTSVLDAICMTHDLKYAYKNTSELDDDQHFLRQITNWAKANLGDGWTGPTLSEKQLLIGMIEKIFQNKSYDGETIEGKSWGQNAFHWSNLEYYLSNYKNYLAKDDEKLKLKHVLVDPFDQVTNIIDAKSEEMQRFMDLNDISPRHPQMKKIVDEHQKSEESVFDKWNTFWNFLDVRSRFHPQQYFKKQNNPKLVEAGMLMPQYLPPSKEGGMGTIVMNYAAKDGLIYSWDYNDQELWNSNLETIADADGTPIYKIYNQRSIDNYKDYSNYDFSPIPFAWSRPVDPGFHFDYEFGENRINKKSIIDYPTPKDYETALASGNVISSAAVVTEAATQIEAPGMPEKPPKRIKEDGSIDMSVSSAEDIGSGTVFGTYKGSAKEADGKTTFSGIRQGGDVSGIMGEVSVNLGPPRNIISQNKIIWTSDVIIRNWHLNSFDGKIQKFIGSQKARKYNAAGTSYANSQIHLFNFTRKVDANVIPLDNAYMCLDVITKNYLQSLPFHRMKFLGGKIDIHGMRYLENTIVNGAVKITSSSSVDTLQNANRKIMYKMYDRERDHKWGMFQGSVVYDVDTSQIETEDPLVGALPTFHSEWDACKDGYLQTSWDTSSFPQLVKLYNQDENSTTMNFDSSQMLQSMKDHTISSGPLSFPIMGWPKYVANANGNTKQGLLRYSDGYWSCAQNIDPVEMTKISFVNQTPPTIEQMVYAQQKNRAINTATTGTGINTKFTSSATFPSLLEPIKDDYTDYLQSSMAVAIHVPQISYYNGSSEYATVQCDLKCTGTFELDLSLINSVNPNDINLYTPKLGAMWDDTIDATFNPYFGLSMYDIRETRANWATPHLQYLHQNNLKASGIGGQTAIQYMHCMDPSANNLMMGNPPDLRKTCLTVYS